MSLVLRDAGLDQEPIPDAEGEGFFISLPGDHIIDTHLHKLSGMWIQVEQKKWIND